MMTPERWQQIEQLFYEALARPVEERAGFLDQACSDDVALRREVESLLASDAQESSQVEDIAAGVAAKMLAEGRSASLIGHMVGRYRVLAPLGSGGMGEVYLAEDSMIGRKVAIKLLPHQYAENQERVRRFEQEARAASALNHPNIITIYEIGHWQDEQFIVSEFIEGETLRQRIERGGLALDEILNIAIQTASALVAAHSAGIVHRDIKPANIMIRSDGYVKVLDFGLAKLTTAGFGGDSPVTESKTDPGRVMGTLHYMSPEQALGQPIDHRTDLFSLGIILYEMATARLPFKGDSDAAFYDALLNRTPQSLDKLNPRLPGEFGRIIARTLEKDRSLRYQTASDLCADLKRLQRDSASHTPGIAVHSGKRFHARLIAIAALVLVAIGGMYLWSVVKQPRQVAPANPPVAISAIPGNISFKQQTDQSGSEYFPALSPDGRTLIYASQETGHWDLWQQNTGQRERVNLTADATSDNIQPAFAPDGQRIAFRSSRDGGGLFIMELPTRKVKRITREGFNPTWSPDGKEIAYGTASVTAVEARSASQLWVVNVESGEKRLVTAQDAVQPAWSPNGQRIAYWSFQENVQPDLWTVPANGGAPRQLTDGPAVDWNPCWSSDGKYLYFTSDRSGNQNLWRIAIDETSGQALSEPEPYTIPSADTMHLSLSRDGRHLAYIQRSRRRTLQALAFDPVNQQVHVAPVSITRGTGFATHPSLSPDGQWLAYCSAGAAQEDIYIIRTDGTGMRQLTNEATKKRLPRWSPDGRRIAFFSEREGKSEIWAIAPSGDGTVEQLTFEKTGRSAYPTWSPDGNFLAYYRFKQGSFLLDMRKAWDQQTPQPVAVAGFQDAELAVWDWSPDGQKLACEKFIPGTQQIAVTVYWFATRESDARVEIIAEGGDFPAWLNDSERLLFIRDGKIFLADIRTKAQRQIFAPGADQEAEYCTVSRDNRTIYYSLSSTESDIWLATMQP